jgi:phage regulator Rha-like protein
METDLEIVLVEDEHRLDSRLLARYLGYEHETIARSILRHKARLEKKGALRQFVGVLKHEGYRGSTRQTYYMLDERQCLILAGSLKRGDEAEEWQDALIDAFLQARKRVRELEVQQQQSPQSTSAPLINSLWQQRLEIFNRETRLPSGYWCVYGFVAGHCWMDEFRDVHLVEEALPDGSIGKRFCKHLREHGFDLRLIKKYPHRYPDKRGVQWANIYPNDWLGEFWTWFQHYLKYDYPEYLRTHTRALQVPTQRRQLPGHSQE